FGTVRTSARSPTSASRRRPTNSSIVRVECPMVKKGKVKRLCPFRRQGAQLAALLSSARVTAKCPDRGCFRSLARCRRLHGRPLWTLAHCQRTSGGGAADDDREAAGKKPWIASLGCSP